MKRKEPLDEPIIFELARIEDLKEAHPIDFPSEPKPIADLAGRIPAPEGRLTLHADWADRWQGGVVVYLVNRSGRDLELPLYGDDSYPLRLESLSENGACRRAQRA